jgi:xylan 1,4-beta-xylosidase
MRAVGAPACILALLFSPAAAPAPEPPAGEATFSSVTYSGHDPAEDAFPTSTGEYRNPILPGFQPDPSILRVGDDYYLTNSSFAFFPGLPIYHSRDLVNWQQVGNAIDRPEQFSFAGLGIARAIFAPTLRWHDGVFYIVGTCVDCGSSFILTARDPAGPWSAPTWLPSVDGVDPDLFIDGGRAWITNNGPPPGPAAYAGHRALWLQEFDLKTLTTRGERSVLVNGGVNFSQRPIWIEGPHLIRKGRWFYLIAAEGGTAHEHSEVVFRSRRLTGPYVPAGSNPILTQRDLDPARQFPIEAAGHADFVETARGDWWAVFLATRPYAKNLSNLGRETFLLPVVWHRGWPQILTPGLPVPHTSPRPRLPAEALTGRASWHDKFNQPSLSPDWEMIRTPAEPWYRQDSEGLTLRARRASISGSGNPSFLGKRQRHVDASIETEMHYRPDRSGECAGLVAFADERHHYFLGLCQTANGPMLEVTQRNGTDDPEEGRVIAAVATNVDIAAPMDVLRLRIGARGPAYDFSYAGADGVWHALLENADGTILASEPTNQFTGTLLGVYAVQGP